MNQTGVLRYNYFDYALGTCQETLLGGNHLRYWTQTGSRAIFMAVSYEQDLAHQHNILTPDGYDRGRDWLVGNATQGTSKSPVTNLTYTSTSTLVPGYLTAGSSVGVNHGLVLDGLVAVLVVKANPATDSSGSLATPASSGSIS